MPSTTVLSLTLDSEALHEATKQAILGALSPEVREKILQNAIEELLKPSTSPYNRGQSKIEEIFQNAVSRIACEEANKMMSENAEIRAKLQILMQKTAIKLLDAEPDKFSAALADAIHDALKRERRD
jgi:FKBP-type peptidyl-prolyl cis-trans isomerase (trigger factor)